MFDNRPNRLSNWLMSINFHSTLIKVQIFEFFIIHTYQPANDNLWSHDYAVH